MKLILTTAVLALAIVASPAAARLSQPGNSNSPIVSDHRIAMEKPGESTVANRLAQPGNPNSAFLAEPRTSAPRMAVAMMSCCPKDVDAPVHNPS